MFERQWSKKLRAAASTGIVFNCWRAVCAEKISVLSSLSICGVVEEKCLYNNDRPSPGPKSTKVRGWLYFSKQELFSASYSEPWYRRRFESGAVTTGFRTHPFLASPRIMILETTYLLINQISSGCHRTRGECICHCCYPMGNKMGRMFEEIEDFFQSRFLRSCSVFRWLLLLLRAFFARTSTVHKQRKRVDVR